MRPLRLTPGLRSLPVCLSLRSLSSGPDQLVSASDHRAWTAEGAVRLRVTPSGPQSVKPRSVPTLLSQTVEKFHQKTALRTRTEEGDSLSWSYSQYLEEVRLVARAWISLGLLPHHTLSVLGHPHPRQHIANMAAIHAGAFAGGMYQTNTAEACKYIAKDSRANIIVVGDTIQLEKILSIRSELPDLRAIVLFEGETNHPGVLTWKQVLQIGKDNSEGSLDERLRNIAINQCCVLSYTSGTTGNPKGTMMSHDNVVFTAVQNTSFFKWSPGEESVLSYLPQCHMAGVMMDQFMVMAVGGECCFADKNALKGTLLENIVHYKPSRFMGVTRIFEKIEEGIKSKGSDTKGLKKKIVDWAKAQALHHHTQEESGKPHNSFGYTIAKKLIFNKVD